MGLWGQVFRVLQKCKEEFPQVDGAAYRAAGWVMGCPDPHSPTPPFLPTLTRLPTVPLPSFDSLPNGDAEVSDR